MLVMYFSDSELLIGLLDEEQECLREWFTPDGDRDVLDYRRTVLSGWLAIQVGYTFAAARQYITVDH